MGGLAAVLPIVESIIQKGGPALATFIAFLREHGDADDVADLNAQIVELERIKSVAQGEIDKP